ncbi:MAG: cytochrome c maturation protein CcmE [Chloroflexi bacterium]|nr:cytochrome c maturation protein CcmE [Chloroflexota bacterium]
MNVEKRHAKLKWHLLIGGAVIALVIVYVILSTLQDTAIYALTISELKAQSPAIYTQNVRVGGTVDGNSIAWDAGTLTLQFNLVDGDEVLPVIYKGTRPDMFRDGAEALVEGRYQRNGIFEATKLLLKCPAKYEAAATMTAERPEPSPEK